MTIRMKTNLSVLKRFLIFFILLGMGGAYAQNSNSEMYGVVKDQFGEPLLGVSIILKNNTLDKVKGGVTTDLEGKYRIASKDKKGVVIFSFVGMKTKQIPFRSGKVNVILQESSEALEEVIVTGYQTISKERTTGSYATLKSGKIQKNIQPNLASRLEGLVPGVVVDKDGDIQIRGVSSLMADKKPLIVLDGVPYEGGLSSINHADVKSVTVLKDASASSIYGAKAANGVIVIVSKKGANNEGKINVSFSQNIIYEPKPDFSDLNLLNNSELVDLQLEGLEFYSSLWKYLGNDAKVYENPLFMDYKNMQNGILSKEDFDKKVLNYRRRSNRKDLESFMKHSLRQDQTLSISGGNSKNTFYTSLNYISDGYYLKGNDSNSIRLYLRDDLKLFEWLKSYASITGKISNSKNNEGFDVIGAYLYQPSYKLLRDENGNPLNYNTEKSQLEVDRLVGLGLQNENYYPFQNYSKEYSENKKRSLVLNVGLNFKIMEGLNFDFKYGNEFYDNKYTTFWEDDSYHIRKFVNDGTTVKDGVNNIPLGARLQKTISDGNAYTLRGQLNFNKTFGKHSVMALLGAERRRVIFKTDRMDLWGYDELSLKYQPLNYDLLRQLKSGGTYGVFGALGVSFREPLLQETENRFVSFYGNASYTFDKKYTINGSIRTDQSNLFGSDPKYRYKPLWSVGAKWSAHREEFLKDVDWLNKLAFRFSYGIVGNVANSSFPVLVIEDQGIDRITGRKSAIIYGNKAPNPSIRWEKTETNNVGFDLSVFQNRLNVSLDLYHKNTTDLLGRIPIDPTQGFKNALKNYGNMVNKGIELGVNGTVINTDDFNWSSFVSFGYNKNELKYVEEQKSDIFDIANYYGYNKESYPINSLFSFRYAGLDDKGQAMYFNSKDEKVYEIDSFDDLEYSGTKTPLYTASWSNSVTYKGFTLSGMLSFYGGHVMRLPKARILGIYDIQRMNSNLDRDILNHWKEGNKGENATPTFTSNHRGIERINKFWASADKNTAKADFLKLRTLSLTYNLPEKFLSNLKLESFAITLQGTNLFSWYANDEGIDPEYLGFNGTYTTRTLHLGEKTWSLGFNINF